MPSGNEIALLNLLSKFLGVAVGVLYLAGFLVVAIHLSRYGVSGFSVLQLQYLVAGAWTLGLPILVALMIQAQRRFEQRATPDTPGKINWPRLRTTSVLTSFQSGVCVAIFAAISGISWQSVTWGAGLGLFLFYVGMVDLAMLFLLAWRTPEGKGNSLAEPHTRCSVLFGCGTYNRAGLHRLVLCAALSAHPVFSRRRQTAFCGVCCQ